jgi:LmbE family N-acetylglucosaminyl deacetylase
MIAPPLFKHVQRVLCLGAHSDDIEIGLGGTMLRLIEENPRVEITWVVLGGNEIRQTEARKSAEVILEKIEKKSILTTGFRDAYFPSEIDRIKDFVETLKPFNPDLIFTHFKEDAHQDHRVVNQLAWNTFRSHLILEYEILKYDGDLGRPNCYVSLPEQVCQAKIDHLMKAFPTQATRQWYSPDTFWGMLRIRGVEANSPTRFAEAFHARKIVF